jgi:Ni/Fe-hydrogenase 1 B-type cytochrome subunit
MTEKIQRVLIWGGWLRFAHLSLAFACLVLLVSGWLMGNAPSLFEPAQAYHFLAAGLLLFTLLLRLALALFSNAPARAGNLWPTPQEWPAMGAMLRFYMSLGRSTLPRWYAHNPLWKPLYLLLYALLAGLAFSGALLTEQPLLLGWYLPSIHRSLASLVFWLTLLHLLTVILHDLRGKTTDVSAIVHGYRYFVVERPLDAPPERPAEKLSIRLDQIGRGRDA